MTHHSRIPRVSVGIPVYNGECYLEQSLVSILKQSYTDFVVFISDNASTDRTEEICKQYALQDSRISYNKNLVNIGAPGNYECCFIRSKSEYFRWQNADDTIEPTLFEKCLKILDTYPDVVLAYGKSNIIDEESNHISEYNDNLALMQSSPAARFICCLEKIGMQNLMYGLIRREPLAKTARMKTYASSDINLIAELALYGKFYEIDEHLFNRRMHEESSSWDMKDTEKLRRFWNPNKRNLHMQTWRSFFEFYKALFRSPIKNGQKKTIATYLLKYIYWKKNILGSEVLDLFRNNLMINTF